MPASLVVILSVLVILFFLAGGTPIGIVFIIVGFLGSAYMLGVTESFALLHMSVFHTASSYGLASIPCFILMGLFAFEFGLGGGLYTAAYRWLGRLPGGLAIAAVAGCAGFATVTGSATAGVATIGSVSWPEMRKYNYHPRLALPVIATAGTLGVLIPPSIGLIIVGIITRLSIGKLFMAGILPGVLVAFAYAVVIFLRVKTNPQLAPMAPEVSWRERFLSLPLVTPVIFLAILVLGGIYFGIFTPTEAGAVGASLTFLICLAMRRVSTKKIFSAFASAIRISGFIFLIIVGVHFFNSFLAATQVGEQFSEWVQTWPINRYVILAAILFMYIPMGMFVDAIGMKVLTLPFVYPVILALGFNGIVFAILLVRMCEIGNTTPPLGFNVLTMSAVAPDANINDIWIGIIPFILADIVTVVILVAFPQISLFLPSLMRS